MEMTVEEQIKQAYEAGYSEGYADGQYDSLEENGRYPYNTNDDDDDGAFTYRDYDCGWNDGYNAGWADAGIASELDMDSDEYVC